MRTKNHKQSEGQCAVYGTLSVLSAIPVRVFVFPSVFDALLCLQSLQNAGLDFFQNSGKSPIQHFVSFVNRVMHQKHSETQTLWLVLLIKQIMCHKQHIVPLIVYGFSSSFRWPYFWPWQRFSCIAVCCFCWFVVFVRLLMSNLNLSLE